MEPPYGIKSARCKDQDSCGRASLAHHAARGVWVARQHLHQSTAAVRLVDLFETSAIGGGTTQARCVGKHLDQAVRARACVLLCHARCASP